MSRTGQAAIAVRILPSSMLRHETQTVFHMNEIPPRSRLYGPEPCKVGTIWGESLTSYLNRLGWRHGISPRVLMAQELVLQLERERHTHTYSQLATFSRITAMGINGTGDLAAEWSTTLEKLTMRSDLHLLTLRSWVGDLPSRGHLRKKPAWCPLCYTEWKEQGLPIYQPLLWMIQMIMMCARHQVRLENRCSHCQKYQSIIALNTTPGYCTQCNTWLGKNLDVVREQEMASFQEWATRSLEELLTESLKSGVLLKEHFFTNLAMCMKERGTCSKFADITGFSANILSLWAGHKNIPYAYNPPLEAIFEFCYACNVTPLQVMVTPEVLLQVVREEMPLRHNRPRRSTGRHRDPKQCLEHIQAFLSGREEPLGVYEAAKQLGYSAHQLVKHFPQECELMVQQAKEYRRQRREKRKAQACEEVRQAVIALHEQGIFPTDSKVRASLSDPNLMRLAEARITRHAILREIGLE
jgi:hypothetical protein